MRHKTNAWTKRLDKNVSYGEPLELESYFCILRVFLDGAGNSARTFVLARTQLIIVLVVGVVI